MNEYLMNTGIYLNYIDILGMITEIIITNLYMNLQCSSIVLFLGVGK